MSEFRKWWIEPNYNYIANEGETRLWPGIEVIEVSAFDKAHAEIERLEEIISYLPKVPTQPYEKEMAQEIARLTAIIGQDRMDDWRRVQNAERECEHLRAALENIADLASANKVGRIASYRDFELRDIARAALKGE